jgi:hypothetical protein
MKQKLTSNQTQWIVALRSDKYTQTQGCLHDTKGSCCLGVAAQEFITDDVVVNVGRSAGLRSYNGETSAAPLYVVNALGLFDEMGGAGTTIGAGYDSLALLNDMGLSFDKIADMVEANPEYYFEAEI